LNYAAMRYVAETCTAEGAGRALLWAISYRANKHTGECWESLRKLAAAAGISYATAKRAKAELLERGELELVLTSAGRHRATHLRIHVPGLTVSHRDESLQGSNDPAPGLNAPPVQGSNGDPSIRQEGKNVEGGRRSSAAASTAAAEPTADALGSRSASGNGVPPDAATAIAALKASSRRVPVVPESPSPPVSQVSQVSPLSPESPSSGSVARPVSAAAADAQQAAPDPAATTPRRRGTRGRKGRRGREPPATCTRSPHDLEESAMANHKRRRPKSRRAGCLLCKPQKLPANKHGDKAKARRFAFKIEQAT